MYATNGLADLLGINNSQLIGKSFYYCIQENCLREGVKCLESAKANDSIAYLRFWFRDPRRDELAGDNDDRMSDIQSSTDEDDGGVHLSDLMEPDANEEAVTTGSSNSIRSSVEREARPGEGKSPDPNSRSSSGDSTDMDGNAPDALFDRPENQQSRTSSVSTPDEPAANQDSTSQEQPPIELEAVVSCTSDGLVVVLRRARPLVPQLTYPSSGVSRNPYQNGLFASPWANEPILPHLGRQNTSAQLHHLAPPTTDQAHALASQGPTTQAFMNTIREVAVFAWALTGINGSLAQYGRGTPAGDSRPLTMSIWDPQSNAGSEQFVHRGLPGPSSKQHGYKSANNQATAGAVIPRTSYSYLTGLPDSSYYSGSEPMQIDSQTNGSSIDERQYQNSNAHVYQNGYSSSSNNMMVDGWNDGHQHP